MFWNLLKKELKEQLTVSSIVVMIALSFVYAMIGKSVGNIGQEIIKKPSISIVNLDSGEYGNLFVNIIKNMTNVLYEGKSIDIAISKTMNKGTALLIIQKNFTDNLKDGIQGNIKIYWMLKGLGIMDSISSGVVGNILNYAKTELSKLLMKEADLNNPNLVLNPITKSNVTFVKGEKMENISPDRLLNTISSQSVMTSVIIMMLILMAGGSVISSMGLEKENKTLETLLTMPVRRSYIVFSKILASAISGLTMAGIYMVGFSFYMKSFSMSVSSIIENVTLSLSDYFLIGLLLFTALLSGISISMLLGIFSKDFKSAQTMNFSLIALAIFSMLITMFRDFDTLPSILKIITFIIPFTHPMLAMRNLMIGDQRLILWSIIYTALFAVGMIGIVSCFFNSDRLVVGKIKKRETRKKSGGILWQR